jgi:hypothetical protein
MANWTKCHAQSKATGNGQVLPGKLSNTRTGSEGVKTFNQIDCNEPAVTESQKRTA